MLSRNLARSGWRGFALVVALAAVLLAPSPTLVAASTTSLGISVVRQSSGNEVFVIHGASQGQSLTRYGAAAELLRIPCPGRYRFEAETEDRESGRSVAYVLTMALSLRAAAPAGVRCGIVPPGLPGETTVELAGEGEPLLLEASRGGPGRFLGELTLGALPECVVPYTLNLDFELDGWRRSITYRVVILSRRVTAQGPPLGLGCG